MYYFATPLTELKGIGRVTAVAFRRLGITTIYDLVYHIPSGYEDFRQRCAIAAAPVGVPLTLEGVFISFDNRRSWRHKRLNITEGIFQDDTGALKVVWFGQPFLARAIPLRRPLYLSGTLEIYQGAHQMTNPMWERVSGTPTHTSRLVPLYNLTKGLTHKQLRFFIGTAIAGLRIDDWFDLKFRERYGLMPIGGALRAVHFPQNESDALAARRRLAFDELFFLQISRLFLRHHRQTLKAPVILAEQAREFIPLEIMPRPAPQSGAGVPAWDNSRDDRNTTPEFLTGFIKAKLLLKLTADQERAVGEIMADMGKPYPMQRLLQGEVGSGKTIVAAGAALAAIKHGYQVLYLAPTEVLARQHYATFKSLFSDLEASIALLTRSQAEAAGVAFGKRQDIVRAMSEGVIQLSIGTHALLQEKINFAKLGLVIVDEQHRFGVKQRITAQQKSAKLTPHLLSMTATPIPRTMQLAFLGDLDVSILRTMPHGERVIKTFIFGPADRKRVEIGIKRRMARGEQVYVVCPLIDPSDKLGVKSVTAEYERLRQESFPGVKIGLLHGKLSGREKEKILQSFREGETKMLVSTTVIEVGLDVGAAAIIVIEDAERFGLAQLHQLRGRIGRRGQEGICALFTSAPAPRSGAVRGSASLPSTIARSRLEAFVGTTDAFQLAEQDLKLRGPGDWFGTEQSGFMEFKVADLNDAVLLSEAQKAAKEIIEGDPALTIHGSIKEKVDELLQKEHHLS